ncbi:MAG: ethylbenzene dehydrogenase-related protein [Halodesulfurarchaeum sp.]|nr:ethylbenzene dehydrogenase-related protein [Halodesulfurarchaeum sp.]
MKLPRTTGAIAGIALLVVISAVMLPAIAVGVPANQVPVSHQPDAAAELSTPNGAAWSEVESREIPLTSAPSGLPGANVVSTEAVSVKTAHTDSTLYVRMQWDDRTENVSESSLKAFTDGAAVQLPANVSTEPAVELGSQDTPVNLWYWTGASGAEEALAGGYNPGSITAMENTTIETTASHEDGTWTVVFERSLETGDDARADFDLETDVDIAFAVWDGANAERSGHHAYSEWYTMPLGPEPTGPTAQYIFWAVAGIGIVIALVIAARARRGQ